MTNDASVMRPGRQSRWWWIPLALIAVALVLIFAVPLLASRRLEMPRRHSLEVTGPALVRVNDFAAALATEMAAHAEEPDGGAGSAASDSTASAARSVAIVDEHVLDSLVQRVGPEATTQFRTAMAAVSAWRGGEDLRLRGVPAGADAQARAQQRASRWHAAELALSQLQRLEDLLSARSAAQRAEIMRLERIMVVVPASLAPLALLALAALAWTAKRTRELSAAAVRGQAAAERAMASRAALMRGVTHDLKNPLGAAQGYADLLADGFTGPVGAGQTRIIERLRNLIGVTLDTVNDLVELSRVDAGALRVHRQRVDLARVAREAVDDYRAIAETAGIELAFRGRDGDGTCHVVTDPARVRQVLGNLLSNVTKYTPRGGSARVAVDATYDAALGDAVRIEVRDTGPGVPADLAERVFEEFFRAPGASTSASGTGVGLAIARRVARLLGGDLRLERPDMERRGARFVLVLPREADVAN